MLLVVPKPAMPFPPSPSLHVHFLLSGEQPTCPSLPANRSCPQQSGSKSPPLRSPPRLLPHLCPGEHLQGHASTTEDRPLFTHSRASGHGLFKGAGYFSFIFPPQSSAEDSPNIWTSRKERKAWKTKGEEHRQARRQWASHFIRPRWKVRDKTVNFALTGLHGTHKKGWELWLWSHKDSG